MKQEPRFNVLYYKQADKYLAKLDVRTRQKILDNIDIARCTLDAELLKKLTGDIWEFRTKYNGKSYRLLAFWDKRNNQNTLVIATHGFLKKTQKTPKEEIERAKSIMKQYFGLNK